MYQVKVLFLNPMPGLADLVSDSWPWEKGLFRYQRSHVGGGRAMLPDFQADVIVYLGIPLGPNLEPREWALDDATLRRLRNQAPLVHVVLDGGIPGWEQTLWHYDRLGCFSAQVNTDGCLDWPLANRPNCMSELIPNRYPDMQTKRMVDRPTDFGFSGGTGGPGHPRHEIIEELRRTAGLAFTHRPHFPDKHPGVDATVDYSDYYERMTTYKVALNVAHMPGARQVKGRVLDAGAASCCLLETQNSASRHWFMSGEDYEEYADAADAAVKAQALLADLPRAQAMADRLRDKVRRNHAPVVFWTKVLGLVGLKCQ
jgi:hypothetical protein